MAKLNQIIAIEKGVKSRVYSEISEINKVVQKGELFNGFAKTYSKKEEEGEDLPAERKKVQFNSSQLLNKTTEALSELFDVTARKDWTNCAARADIRIDGKTIASDVPVTYLLFLEKQLTDIRTLIGNLPVLDDSEDWARDDSSGLFKTPAIQTHRTKKVPKAIVLYPATEQHPAQTQMVTDDIIAGFWNTVKFSGALPKPEKDRLSALVEKVINAVKEAREEANGAEEVTPPNVGAAIFGYILRGNA